MTSALRSSREQVDGFTTDPQFLPKKVRAFSASKRPEIWSQLFARAMPRESFAAFLAPTGAFADEYLRRLSTLVQLPPALSQFRSDEPDATGASHWVEWYRQRPAPPSVRQIGGVTDFRQETSRRLLLVGESTAVFFQVSADVHAFARAVWELSGSALENAVVEIPKLTGLRPTRRRWRMSLPGSNNGYAGPLVPNRIGFK